MATSAPSLSSEIKTKLKEAEDLEQKLSGTISSLEGRIKGWEQGVKPLSTPLRSPNESYETKQAPASHSVSETKLNGLSNGAKASASENGGRFTLRGQDYPRPVHTLEKVRSQIAAGLKSRQPSEIKRVFEENSVKTKENGENLVHIPKKRIRDALKQLNIVITESEVDEFYSSSDLNSNGYLEFDEFNVGVASVSSSPVEAWVQTLPLARVLADALPKVEDGDSLSAVASLTDQEQEKVIEGFSLSIKSVFAEHIRILRQSINTAEAQVAASESQALKFTVVKLSCGKLEDFHEGLHKRVGACHLDFENAMRAEHCIKLGCDLMFTTTNYGITSTPKAEWEYVVGEGNKPTQEAMGNGRRIPKIDELLKHELATRSKLTKPEVIAVVLYTGPMFFINNVILRQYPMNIYNKFKQDNTENLFPTTIFVLVSAVQKISRVMKLPDNLKLYRGLGGTSEFPDQFFNKDANGCRGFAEWGFMSTTASKNVAIQYSGIAEGKPLLYVLEIRVGAVDRGACVRDFSQYPHEIEYLFVPCSFLELDGPRRLDLTDDGTAVVTVFPVKVNANLKTQTVEELLVQKQTMHSTAFAYLIDDIGQELRLTATPARLEQRQKEGQDTSGPDEVEAFLTRIVQQCNEVRNRHKAVNAKDFANDLVFRRLMLEMVEVKVMATSKLSEWLENTTSSFIRFRHNAALRTVHRRYLHFLEKRFEALPSDSSQQEKRKAAALRLCQVHGLLSEGVNEQNELEETRLMSAAAEGKPTRFLRLMVEAGADVNAIRPDGVSAMWLAAQFGHKACIVALENVKADVNLAAKDGATPVYIAAQNGNAECIKTLFDLKADVNRPDLKKLTPAHQAAMNGQIECIQVLDKLGADLGAENADGKTPLDLANQNKHQACIEFLKAHKAAGGKGPSTASAAARASGKKKLILSTGDISDIDGFLALAEYAKAGADVLFMMNYPAYIGVREDEVDDGYASNNPGLGYRYSAREVLGSVTSPDPSYTQFLSAYKDRNDNERMKGAMTDVAFIVANQIWAEASAGGKLLFCIGGINAVNPFSAKAIKNEILVYSKLIQRPADSEVLQTSEGMIYGTDRSAQQVDFDQYSDIYIDFNGSMAFWNEAWNATLSNHVNKVKGVFIMGGVHADRTPVTMPAIPGVLNRFSSATMNQLYHPQKSVEFLAFAAQNKIPTFTITNNVVGDLTNMDNVERFLASNGLTGESLRKFAKAHYTSQYNPPKKPFDFYTAVALRAFMDGREPGAAAALRRRPRQLFCNNVYGITYVSGSSTWEGTRAAYVGAIDVSDSAADDERARSKKGLFRQEIALLKAIDSLASMHVFDLSFRLDESMRLTVSAAQD